MRSITAGLSKSDALADADVAVMTASVPRPADSAKWGGRAEFLDRNLELVTEIGATLRERDPMPVVLVSNLVDRLTYRIWLETGWDRSYFMGYSFSETARAADRITSLRNVSASDVYCPIAGEHGEHVVPLFSRLTIDGESATLTKEEWSTIRDYVWDVPYDVIVLRGAEETSRWVTGQGVARLTSGLIDGGFDSEPIALSVPLDGEYGLMMSASVFRFSFLVMGSTASLNGSSPAGNTTDCARLPRRFGQTSGRSPINTDPVL